MTREQWTEVMSVQNELRRLLRPLLKAGRLEARQTYYDFYDSCHAPLETPDAKWTDAGPVLRQKDLLKGGALIVPLGNGVYELKRSYMTLQVRLKGK
jgi:hypothetical protein